MTKKLLYVSIISFALSSAVPANAGWWSSLTQSISTWWSNKDKQKTAAVVMGAVTTLGIGYYVWKWWQRPVRNASTDAQTMTDDSYERTTKLSSILARRKNNLMHGALSQWRQKAALIGQAEEKRKKATSEVATAEVATQTAQEEQKKIANAAVATQTDRITNQNAQTETEQNQLSQVEQKKETANAQTQTEPDREKIDLKNENTLVCQANKELAQSLMQVKERESELGEKHERACVWAEKANAEMQRMGAELKRLKAQKGIHSRAVSPSVPGCGNRDGLSDAERKDGESKLEASQDDGHVLVVAAPALDNAAEIEAHFNNCLHRVESGENITLDELRFVREQLRELHAARAVEIAQAPQGEQQKLRDLYLGTAAQWPDELEAVLAKEEKQEAQALQEIQSDWQPIFFATIDKKIIEDAKACLKAMQQKQKIEPSIVALHTQQLETLRTLYHAKLQRGTDPKVLAEQLEKSYTENMRTASANSGVQCGPRDGYKCLGLDNEQGEKMTQSQLNAKISKELGLQATPESRKKLLRQIQTLFATSIAKEHYDHYLAGTLDRLNFNSPKQQLKLMTKLSEVVQLKGELDACKVQDQPRLVANSADLLKPRPKKVTANGQGQNGHGNGQSNGLHTLAIAAGVSRPTCKWDTLPRLGAGGPVDGQKAISNT